MLEIRRVSSAHSRSYTGLPTDQILVGMPQGLGFRAESYRQPKLKFSAQCVKDRSALSARQNARDEAI